MKIEKVTQYDIYDFENMTELLNNVDIDDIYNNNYEFMNDILNDNISIDIENLICEFMAKLNKYKDFKDIIDFKDFHYCVNVSYARNDYIYLSTTILERFIESELDLIAKMGLYFSHSGGGICNINNNLNDILAHNEHLYIYEFAKLEKFFKLYGEFLDKWQNLFYSGKYELEVIKGEIEYILFDAHTHYLTKSGELILK